MVRGAARGTGTGTALLAAGERAMTDGGFSRATLWVVPENQPAVRCYARGGWTPDGTQRRDDIGGRSITSVRYEKLLTPRPLGR
jgi:RimJ/RimL family protein N-acetyltransferase